MKQGLEEGEYVFDEGWRMSFYNLGVYDEDIGNPFLNPTQVVIIQTQNSSFKGIVLFDELNLLFYNFNRTVEQKFDFLKLDEKFLSYNLAVKLPNHAKSYRLTVEWKVTQLIRGGFFNHWMEPYLNHRSILERKEKEDKIVLTMEHLSVGFTIWLACLAITSIAFIAELTRIYFPK